MLSIAFFYAFTGCDLTSYFFEHSKLKWWTEWHTSPLLTKCFTELSWMPNGVSESNYELLETFVCNVYDTQGSHYENNVNKLRFILFSKSSSNNLRKLPPCRDALHHHINRAAYVGGWVWGSILSDVPCPPPTEWSWLSNDQEGFIPIWQTNSTLCPDLNSVLLTCSCTSQCTKCKCFKQNIACLSFCKCNCN